MVEEDNLFSTVQQHLQGGLPQYRSSADIQPRYTDSDTLPIDGSDKIKQPPKAHESQIHIPNNALVQQRDPYLHPSIPENNSIHSNPSYPHFPNDHAWAESDLELPLTKFGSTMNFAEDEADETRQLHYSMAPKSRDSLLNSHDSDLQSEFDLASPEPKGRFSWTNSDILKRRIAQRQKGIGRQSMPVVSWFLALAMVGAFIAELIIAKQTTGQAIQTRPQVQPMIGPSAEFMISFGARFVPCMRNVPGLPATNKLPCLQYTTTSNDTFTEDQLCSLSQICGLSDASHPNQSWRFVSAIFLHSGIIHILFNLLVLLTLCCQIEKLIGSIAYTLVFMAGGIGGNLLGGNFGLIGQPALGASGSIYSCISLEIIDLIYNLKYENRARTRIIMSLLFTIIGLGLGLLPGIDNFSHIGGFCVGILGGMVFAPSIHATRSHMIGIWTLRIAGISLLLAYFVALGLNFYQSADPRQACRWCRYLSCLPVFESCKGVGISTTNANGVNSTN